MHNIVATSASTRISAALKDALGEFPDEVEFAVPATRQAPVFSRVMCRSAGRADASALASMFSEAYPDSSHPCQEETYLADALSSSYEQWVVAEVDGQIAACHAAVDLRWSGVTELCRGVTAPGFQGLRLGSLVYEHALQLILARPDVAVVAGHPRSSAMLKIARRNAFPLSVVGHDNRLNFADGNWEHHLVTLGLTVTGAREHAGPPTRVSVDDAPLAVNDEAYPCLGLVEPHRAAARVRGAIAPEGADTAVMRASSMHDDHLGHAAEELRRLSGVRHVSAFVLADKRDLVFDLRELGMEVNAYLPAWYAHAGRRYDCVWLTRVEGSVPVADHGVNDLVDHWRTRLQAFYASRRSIRANG